MPDKSTLIGIVLFIISLNISARVFFIEPDVGVNISNRKVGWGAHARVGYYLKGNAIFFGGEGGLNKMNSQETDGSLKAVEGENTLFGAMFGFSTKTWRIWGTYFFNDDLTWKHSSGDREYSGYSVQLAGSAFIRPPFSLNLAYRSHFYDIVKDSGEESNASYYYDSAYVSISYIY